MSLIRPLFDKTLRRKLERGVAGPGPRAGRRPGRSRHPDSPRIPLQKTAPVGFDT